MIPQLIHPWLPQKMVLGGLPLVEVLIRLVPDAPFAAKELDAVLSNQLPMAHQPAMDSLFLTGLRLFLACNAQVAAQHVEMRHLLLDLLASLSLVMQLFF